MVLHRPFELARVTGNLGTGTNLSPNRKLTHYVDLPGAENCCGVSWVGDHLFLDQLVGAFLSGCWRTTGAGKGHGLA